MYKAQEGVRERHIHVHILLYLKLVLSSDFL